jgi:predicted dehydrogenase
VRRPLGIGVVGLDGGGPALAQQFDALPQTEVLWLCDTSPELRLRAKIQYGDAEVTAAVEDLLADEAVDAIVLGSPPTNSALVEEALAAEKHVLVPPPLALLPEEADELVHRAEVHGRCLMVAEPTLYEPAVRKTKELVDEGRLGEICYVRIEGMGAADASHGDGLWRLVGGGISLLLHVVGDQPIEVAGRVESYLEQHGPDVVFCFLRFATGITGHVHVARRDVGSRRLTVIGSERVAVVDDDSRGHGLALYEESKHRARIASLENIGSFQVGDIVRPELPVEQSLRAECDRFVAAMTGRVRPIASGREAAAAVHVLSALERSLGGEGRTQDVRKQLDDGEARVVEFPLT